MNQKTSLQYFINEEVPHTDLSKQQIIDEILSLKLIRYVDQPPRSKQSDKSGGKSCLNSQMVTTIRSVGQHVIQEIGKKLLSGDLNLTKVSFPIKCSVAQSALERVARGTCFFPIYLGKAVQILNNAERLKYVITATIANFFVNCTFLKPLNPVLGETFQAYYRDGTAVYCEQISHHPPITYYLCIGKGFRCYGYYVYETKAGLNSLTLKNKGVRTVEFLDDKNNVIQKIIYNFGEENYSGIFFGTMKIETNGILIFKDIKNNIFAQIELAKVKNKPSDYFQGIIQENNITISNVFGSYMSHIEFDEVRYWDYRQGLPLKLLHEQKPIKSDSSFREDLQLLSMNAVNQAQKAKEQIENNQRQDAILRKNNQQNQELVK
ncbi:hypothetical protein IMG5_195890 [Ichthyophthirius multifiliis]|uniref:Oxysterol binding protein n=1 Tax=Ichthyophthirius multifiliis TaxID=5932 RepID=G0R505_ICHMU|nr:hypothetical protein IMG5_195890 [Ichthyophthirius multifiliis]EGR27407.1 hypothetical protein IMG5_195890 [Ichthyophthirius multifiliis]|eukprot:XP_004024317.1 hypothetical protein IMG5_195890 [Ichthyophthirius multifiliis]